MLLIIDELLKYNADTSYKFGKAQTGLYWAKRTKFKSAVEKLQR